MGLGHCGGLERGSGADDGFAAESFALSAVAAQELGSPPDGVGAVEVAPDGGAEAGARGAAGLFGDLEAGAVPGGGGVALHGTGFLVAEDGFEVRGSAG